MKGLIPDNILFDRTTSYFDELVLKGLGDREIEFVESLFAETSYLGDAGLIEPKRFLDAYRVYQQFVKCNVPHKLTSSLFIWRTVAAEMWLRALDGSASARLTLRI
jgi:hypothetical protein